MLIKSFGSRSREKGDNSFSCTSSDGSGRAHQLWGGCGVLGFCSDNEVLMRKALFTKEWFSSGAQHRCSWTGTKGLVAKGTFPGPLWIPFYHIHITFQNSWMSKRIQNTSGDGQWELEHFGTSSLGMAAEGTVTIYISSETSQTSLLYCTTKNSPVF